MDRSSPINPSLSSKLIIILCISMSYAIFGFIGDLLTVQASDATAIWPASGIALAACLIWGRQVWPGIFIGAFIINSWIGFDLTSFQSILHSTLLVSTISFGAVFQAIAGHFLITRKDTKLSSFQSTQSIVQLLCMGGMVSCVISASVGVTSLVVAGFMPFEEYITNWLIWWLGDTIGVIIFTPLTLIFFASPRKHWKPKIFSVAIPLFIALIVVAAIFAYAAQQEKKHKSLQFKNDASELFSHLKANINQYQENLYNLSSFLNHSEVVTRSEFKAFTKRTILQQNEIQAFAWIRTISLADRQAFEESILKEGIVDFKIFDKTTPFKIAPYNAPQKLDQ